MSIWTGSAQLVAQDGGGALAFKGTVGETSTVTVQGKPAAVGVDNRFEGTAQVTPGTNTVPVTATDPSGNNRTNTYHVSVTSGPKTLGYDANGSLASNGTKTYEWDGENRLTRVLDGGSEVARFSYDGFGRRVQKVAAGVTRTYVYDGQEIVEERQSTGGAIRYVYGPSVDRPLASVDAVGAVSYYLADHLGSIVQTTNSSATVTLTRQYDSFGNLLAGGTVGGYAFTGREWDSETTLYYYRARYYDSKTGRFVSEDPDGLRGGNNLYAYVQNNPIARTDPLGLFMIPVAILPPPNMIVPSCEQDCSDFLKVCNLTAAAAGAGTGFICNLACKRAPLIPCRVVCVATGASVTATLKLACWKGYLLCMQRCKQKACDFI